MTGTDGLQMKRFLFLPLVLLWRAFFWTYDRASWQYDLMVFGILAFVWLTPPRWVKDPMATGPGLIGWIVDQFEYLIG
jgi:hypothetical protein